MLAGSEDIMLDIALMMEGVLSMTEARCALLRMEENRRRPRPPLAMGKFICSFVRSERSEGSLRTSLARVRIAASSAAKTGVTVEGRAVRATWMKRGMRQERISV
jgi:hypothetical protein